MMKKKNVNRKTVGDGNMISALIVTVSILMFLMLSILIYSQISIKQKAEWSLRKYMLAMEVDGYLTSSNRVQLTNKLMDMGGYDISFAGTTMSKVQYGEKIVLMVKGKMKASVIKGIADWVFKVESGYYDISYKYESTYLGGS